VPLNTIEGLNFKHLWFQGSESSSGGGGGGGGGGLGECTDINDCRIIVPVKTGLATQNMAGIIVLTIATSAHLIF